MEQKLLPVALVDIVVVVGFQSQTVDDCFQSLALVGIDSDSGFDFESDS